MRVDNNNFAQRNVALQKSPRYVVEIAFDNANTDLLYVTSHEGTPLPNGAISIQGVLQNITGTSQSVTPEKSLSTIGFIDFDVVDKNGAVTTFQYGKLQFGKGLRNKRVRIYVGYEGLAWGDFILIQTQIVEDVSYENATYSFKNNDIQRQARKDIFTLAQTNITQTILVGDTTVNVTSTTGFEPLAHGTSYSDAPSQTVYYFKVEDEIFRATGKTATSFTGVTGGVLNTKSVDHVLDTTVSEDRRLAVDEYVYLELPAAKLAYAILTGVLIGQGSSTLPSNWHLNISESFVRKSDFENIGTDIYNTTTDDTGFIVRFAGLKKQDGKKFLETELNVLMGAFSPVYSDGAIGLKKMASILSNSGYVYLLNEDNIVSHSSLSYDMTNIHNHIEIHWNWLDSKEKFTRTNILIDQTSISENGLSVPLSFNFRGLYGSRHSAETLGERFNSFRDRYTGPPIRMTVTCLLITNTLEVGDVVRVNLSNVKDYYKDSSLNRSFEVQNISVDWQQGTVTLRLFASSQAAGAISAGSVGTVIEDAWYSAEGINLATHVGAGYDYTTDYENIGGIGHIKLTSSLIGGSDITNGNGTEGGGNSIFYHIGDLTIDAAVILSWTNNIQLRVIGFLTINGGMSSVGGGNAGAADRKDLNQFNPFPQGGASSTESATYIYNNGISGYIGPTVSAGGERYDNLEATGLVNALEGNRVDGAVETVPSVTLEYNYTTNSLNGIPSDLRGTSGSSGGNVAYRYTGGVFSGWQYNMGGAGGDSGGGILIVSRGASFGVSGYIDTSGTDGESGTYQPPATYGPYTYANLTSSVNTYPRYAGGGAGGAPGAVYFAMDGDQQTFPDLTQVVSKYGCTPFNGTNHVSSPSIFFQDLYFPWTGFNFACVSCPPPWYPYHLGIGCATSDLSGYDGGSRVVFVIGAGIPEEDPDAFILPAPTNISVSSGTSELLTQPNGSIVVRAKLTYTAPTDSRIVGYEVQYKPSIASLWLNSNDVIGVNTTEAYVQNVVQGDSYDFRIRSVSSGSGLTSNWLTELNHIVIGKAAPPSDVSTFTASLISGQVVFNWDAIADADLNGYEIRYIPQGSGLTYNSATFVLLAGKTLTSAASPSIPDGLWTFMIKAVDTTGNYSANAATSNLVVTSDYLNVITSAGEYPAWSGTLTNMIKLFDNVLIPDSQQTMNNYTTWAQFENANPDPYLNSYYEIAVPIDAGIDAIVRVWSFITSRLAVGESAIVDPVGLDIDYKTGAGSYAGFIPWSIGEVTARHVKFRIHVNTSIAIPIIEDMVNYIDGSLQSQAGVAVIGASGSTVTYPNAFFFAPSITADPQGTTPLTVTRSNITSTSFDAHVFNSAGTEVGGTIDWTATGV